MQPRLSPASAALAGNELRRGWPVVLACFATAVFAWGFGFYGQSVYLAELHRLHGWSASIVGAATTTMYLIGAVLFAFVHRPMERLGPRVVLACAALLLGAGAVALSQARAPWQLFLASPVMAAGWAGTTTTAIATALACWFDRQRGLAISLALNGASVSGFTVAPVLMGLSERYGLRAAVPLTVAGGLLVLLPLILLCVRPATPDTGAGQGPPAPRTRSAPAYASQTAALRDWRFWSVALPFALALAAQVGFIVHQVAFLAPRLGTHGAALAVVETSFAAMLGRLTLGLFIDRLDQRRTSAASFVSQAVGLGLMLLAPDSSMALYTGSVLFGLSVGNVITLPALLVQREFAAGSFGMVVGLSSAIGQFTLACAPAALGLMHDLTDGYTAVLVMCITLQFAGAILIWQQPR